VVKESIIPLSTQGINLIMKDSLTELRMVCAIAGLWGKLTHQYVVLCHFSGTSYERWNNSIKMGDRGRSKSEHQGSDFKNILPVIVCTCICVCMYVYIPFTACCTRCSAFWYTML